MRVLSIQSAIDALEKEKPTPFVNEDGSIDPFGAGRQNQWYRDSIAIMNLPSAQRWIPFTKRELTAEEQEEHPEWSYIMDCPLPDDGQEILVSNGRWVWKDEFCVDDGCYLDSDHELEGCAWMPLPEPWKGE